MGKAHLTDVTIARVLSLGAQSTLEGNLIPDTADLRTLGDSTRKFLALYVVDLNADNIIFPVQVANVVFAGPTSGLDAAPAFRALVAADLPTFIAGSAGSDFNISGVTFNIPSASATARGLITTTAQILAGNKTFNGVVIGAGGLNGEAFRVGDDVSLWDVDVADTMQARGLQNPTRGLIDFGSGSGLRIGYDGTNGIYLGASHVFGADPGGPQGFRVGMAGRFVLGDGVSRATQLGLGRFSDLASAPLYELQTADADATFGEDALLVFGPRHGNAIWFVRGGPSGDRAYAKFSSVAGGSTELRLFDASALTGGNTAVLLQSDGRVETIGQFVSTLATGTAPLVIASTTVNTNLNADLLDGEHASEFINVGANPVTVTDAPAAGETLVAASSTQAAWQPPPTAAGTFLYKSADQTVNNSTTLVTDTHLVATLVSSTTYYIRLHARISSVSTTSGMQATLETDATLTADNVHLQFSWFDGASATPVLDQTGRVSDLNTIISNAVFTTTISTLIIEGTIEVAVGGVLNFRWAQNTAEATNLNVQRGSIMIVQALP